MEIKKGTLIIGIYLGLVVKEEKKGLVPNFIIIDGNNRETYWPTERKDELIPVFQTNPKTVKTVNTAVRLYYKEIIKELVKLVPRRTKSYDDLVCKTHHRKSF